MVVRKAAGALTKEERKIVKALLAQGWRNQDIQALVNTGRNATINSARITEVKTDKKQKSASKDEVSFFQIRKKSFDPKTGLNFFDDERLIRSREAMIGPFGFSSLTEARLRAGPQRTSIKTDRTEKFVVGSP